jgi:hypothetical protein
VSDRTSVAKRDQIAVNDRRTLGGLTQFLTQFCVSGSAKYGEMAEWLKAHAWKACVGETLPRVRIPLSPPSAYGSIPDT